MGERIIKAKIYEGCTKLERNIIIGACIFILYALLTIIRMIISGHSISPIIFIYIIIFIIPIVVRKYREWCKKIIEVSVSESRIYGTTHTLFIKKEISIPIEKCDNIFIRDGIMDKIRGGKTVAVQSNKSLIKIAYVTNAEKFRDAAIEIIDKHQGKIQVNNVSDQNNNSNSVPEELKKYKELLDSDVITQEEFELKKKELLGL